MTVLSNLNAASQQIRSKDGAITFDIVKDVVYDSIFPQCDFSLIDVPLEASASKDLFEKLYETQRANHCCLCTARQPRKIRLATFFNTIYAELAGFKFHDIITLVSQGAYKCVPSNLSPIGEPAVLFTKANDVNKEATAWFRPDFGDCTNVWDLTPQEGEFIAKTNSRHFCMEMGILMANCASPLICRKFLLLQVPETGHADFAWRFKIGLHGITTDELCAKRVVRHYNSVYLEGGRGNGKRNQVRQ